MGVLNRLGYDPLAVLRQRYWYWSNVLACLKSLLGTIPSSAGKIKHVADPVWPGCSPDLHKSALLQGEQLLVYQCEWQPQEFAEVMPSTCSLSIEHLQDEITHHVGRHAGIGQRIRNGGR